LAPRPIGDINGDGRTDFYVLDAASGTGYLFFGPFDPTARDIVTDLADVVVDTSVLGTLVERSGDVNADGRDDLVFTKQSGAKLEVRIAYQGTMGVWPRSLTELERGFAGVGADQQLGFVSVQLASTTGASVSLVEMAGSPDPATGKRLASLVIDQGSKRTLLPFTSNASGVPSAGAAGDLPFAPGVTALSQASPVTVVGDLDGDGLDDIGVPTAGGIAVRAGNGRTTTMAIVWPAGTTGVQLVGLGDLDADSYDDFATVATTGAYAAASEVTTSTLPAYWQSACGFSSCRRGTVCCKRAGQAATAGSDGAAGAWANTLPT
jgi:hypothetical protein